MGDFYKHRMLCEDCAGYVYVVNQEPPVPPCPINPAHTIVSMSHVIIESSLSQMGFDGSGNVLVSDQPLSGVSKNFYMPNMTDPCAWYEGGIEVPDQALTDDGGDHKTWSGPVGHKWIDLFHHRVHDEHALDRDAYKTVIEVSADAGQTWTPVDECHQAWDPATEQYDYTLIPVDEVFIHYSLSKVVFGSSQDGNLVRASYYKANGFKFTVEPTANKKIDVIYAEVQGSKDLVFTCAVVFKVYMYIEGMGVVEVARSVYGTMWNYIDEARGNCPTCQAMGGKYRYGEVRRGMAQDSMLMPFPYQTKSTLLSSAQMKIVVEFEEGVGPWLGEHGTGTFYCISLDEA